MIKIRRVISFISCFIFVSFLSLGQETLPLPPQQHNHISLDQTFTRFIENKGQWKEEILFLSELPNSNVFIHKNAITYYLRDNGVYNNLVTDLHNGLLSPDANYTYQAASIRMELVGSSDSPIVEGLKSYNEKRNYFLGDNPEKWGRNVLSYQEVKLSNVYKGIDMKIMHVGSSIKYEFTIAPKTSYKDIKLNFHGNEGLSIDEYGRLRIKTGLEDIIEDAPLVYQIINGKYHEITSEYVINEDSTVSYKLTQHYSRKYPLVIDPQLIFSTASGSVADNWGNTACLDNAGNLYTGGTVFANPGTGFPATTGAFQESFQLGDTDIGILKFDSSGQDLIYATYIGGDGTEIPTSTITNEKGELFILGVTGSTNFPAAVNTFSGGSFYDPVGGYQFDNGSDIMIIKLDSTGSNVIKSIYVGGPGNDGNNLKLFEDGRFTRTSSTINNYGDELRGELILDAEDNIYVASSTNNGITSDLLRNQSPDFFVKNALQPDFGGGHQDGVVFKVHHSLDSLVWSTYLGGEGADAAYGIKIASDSSIFVTGISGGNFFERDANSYNPDFMGLYDAYVARISPDGQTIMNYTYLGTEEKDAGYFIELDSEDNPHVLGQTYGDYGHSSEDIFFNDREGIFIQKLTPELDSSIYFTTVGDTLSNEPSPNISPTAFLINECGNVFISGWSGTTNYPWIESTTDLPVTPQAFQQTSDGSDFYMAVFLEGMDSLLFATYFGVDGVAEHVDGGTSRFDDDGIVYQSVCAGCGFQDFDDIILFPDPSISEGEYPQPNASPNCNNGVFKYDLTSLNASIGVQDTCGPLTASFTNRSIGGVDFQWFFGDGESLSSDESLITHQYQESGIYQVLLIATDLTTCRRKDTASLTVRVDEDFIDHLFEDTICSGSSFIWDRYTDNNTFTYLWEPNVGLSDNSILNPEITIGDTSINYIVSLTSNLGCIRTDTVEFLVPRFEPNFSAGLIGNCELDKIPQIELISSFESNFIPESFLWIVNEDTVTSEGNSFVQTATEFGRQELRLEVNIDTCGFDDTLSIIVPELEIPNIMTPNNDGFNDEFVISGIEETGAWGVSIFNRWGKGIFETDDYQNDWAAIDVQDGTYFYELRSPDGNRCKGWLQLIR